MQYTTSNSEARLTPGRQEDLMGKEPQSIYPFTVIMGDTLSTCDYTPVYLFQKKVFVSAKHIFGAGKEQSSNHASYSVKIAMKEIEDEWGRSFSLKKLIESSTLVQFWEWLTSKKIALNDEIVNEINELAVIITKQTLFNTLYQLFPFLSYLPTQFSQEIKRAQEIKNKIFLPEYRAH